MEAGDDNVMATFIMFQVSLGEKSRFYEQIMMWPRDTDILMNWNESDLEWLQDESLVQDAEKGYDAFLA